YHFAVDKRALSRQLRNCACDGEKFFRPVEAVASEQFHFTVIEAGLNAIAVKLDLMGPIVTIGGFVAEGGEAGRHKCRQGFSWPLKRGIALNRGCLFVGKPDRSYVHLLVRRGFCILERPLRCLAPRSVASPLFFRAARYVLHSAASDD